MAGTGPATIRDVARAAGVSRAAVSKVIRNAYGVSPAMRARVEEAIETLGYRPRTAARAMRGSGYTIGLALPRLGDEFFTQVVEGIHAGLVGTGYQLIVSPDSSEVRSSQSLDALHDRQVDGIVAVSSGLGPEDLERLASSVPLVLVGRHDPSRAYDTVTGDDRGGADQVMTHLLGLGHTAIAHLTRDHAGERGGDGDPVDPHGIRLAVYTERMVRAGLTARTVRCGPAQAQAAAATLELLGAPDPPTAVFAGNDTLALGALRAVADLDARVAVVGYDGVEVAGHPLVALTTVDQGGTEMGLAAARLLLERISGRTEPVHEQLATRLVPRRSTLSVRTTSRGAHE